MREHPILISAPMVRDVPQLFKARHLHQLLLTFFEASNQFNHFNENSDPIRVNPLNDLADGFKFHSYLSILAKQHCLYLFSKFRFSAQLVKLE